MVSIIVGKWDINNLEGKGSDEHVVLFITDTILINSSLVIIVNLSNKFAHVMFCYDVLLWCSVMMFCYGVLLWCSVIMFCYDVLLWCSVMMFCYDVML